MFRSVSNFIRRSAGWNFPGIFLLRNGILEDSTQTTYSSTESSDSIGGGNTKKSSGFTETTKPNESTGINTNITELPPVVIYTDGSCIENRASGIGIYFGHNHPLNKSEAIHGYEHNSGLAEIIAAKTALKSLRKWNFYK
ncbi:unnamed protein product [Onchocerca flexuosa]|nr:unnamed protein product [Onchocerca flexuosa]